MKTFIEVVGRKLDAIFCDICGNNCMGENAHDNEFASLKATWGYDSKKDLTYHDIDLCESCFDKTIDFLKSQRKEVPSNNDPLEGSDYSPV